MGNWVEEVFIQILNMSITAGYCIIAVLLLRLIFQKAPRKYLYALWLVVAFRLVCPVSFGTELSLFNMGQLWLSAPTEEVGAMEYIALSEEGTVVEEINTGSGVANVFVNQQLPHAVHTVTGYSMKKWLQVVFPYLASVWAAGVAVFLAYGMLSAWRLKRSVRWAVRTEAEVYECDDLASPFAIGVFRPRIYLPCHLEGKQRQMILLHEQCHIHRKDHLVKLLAFFLLAVYWFHPLVWAAWSGMCRDMEMSCDEKVLELLGEAYKKEYSLTLLAFAAEGCFRNRILPGFGEYDVKSRIRHALSFQRPALWAGVLAVALLVAVLLVFGTNGKGNELSEAEDRKESEYSEEALLLYESRNPYVGDISSDGEVIRAIRDCLPEFSEVTAYKTELQTSKEPYQFHFILEESAEDGPKLDAELEATLTERMVPAAALMIALIDNLGEVKWSYLAEQDGFTNSVYVVWNAEDLQRRYGIESLKEYGSSPEKVQELLDIIEENPIQTEAVFESSVSSTFEETFLDWYGKLPHELYQNAMPHGSEYWSYQDAETMMTILAQTQDKVVTVYGCSSEKYGNRGITIDYRITPNGDSNHTYLDFGWNSTQPGYEVAAADYDGDGRDEIALTYLELMGGELYRQGLVVFETFETGHLEPCYFNYDARQAELEKILGIAYDRENMQVHLLNRYSPESSVPLMSISHLEETKYEYEGEATDVVLQNMLFFSVGEKIWMSVEPGVILENRDTALLARYGIPREEDWKIQLRVEYHFSDEGGYFTLSDPKTVWIYR